MYLNILYISIIWVLILDQFHFWDEITSIFSGMITNGLIKKPIQLKPFSCSLCMSWWTSLLYVLIIGKISILTVLFILLVSFTTPIINQLLTLIKMTFIKMFEYIADKINI